MTVKRAPRRRPASVSPGETAPGDSGFAIGWTLAAGLFFGLALLYFFPALLPGRGIYGTDYLAGGYPFSEFIASRLRAGELPKWVPYVLGGLPLFANAGSTFYPVWLLAALVFPVSFVLPVLFVVQFGLAGLGMFLLMRELEVRPWIALVGALAFQFTGLTMSFVFAGHDGRIIVATLAPLFLYFLHRLVRTGRAGSFVGTAATLGFALLSFQVQSAYYLLLAGLAWGIFSLRALRIRGRAIAARLGLGFGAVAVAFLLGSVNFLPFLDYVEASPRGGEEGRGYEYAVSWDMAPREVTGLAVPEIVGASVFDPETGDPQFPDYTGHNALKYHTEYVGAFVLLLLVLGGWYARRDPYWWFFLALAVFALSISFGGHTPIYRLYYELLPGTRRFRAPSISFFLVSVSLVTMAGLALERLARVRESAVPRASRRDDPLAVARWATLGAAALGLLLLVAGSGAADAARGMGMARFAIFFLGVAGVLWAWVSGRLGTKLLATALVLLVVVDLWVIDRRFFHTVSAPEELFPADDVVIAMRNRPGEGRAWIIPAAFTGGRRYREGNYLMLHDIDQAGGEHPNPLQSWYEFVGEGRGHYVDWHNFMMDPVFRNAANIRWIVSMARLENVPQFPAVTLIHGGPSALVYENTDALPRAYLVGGARVAENADAALEIFGDPTFDVLAEAIVYEPPPPGLRPGRVAGEARVSATSPDEVRVAVSADRPALLVLADNYYPGWEATIDDEAAPVLRANHTFRAVAVPAGDHEVVFRFRPADLLMGFWIYLATIAGLGVLAAWPALRRIRARRPTRPPAGIPTMLV